MDAIKQNLDRQTGLMFDKKQSNIVKGIAILMLLWHHLFINQEETLSKFTSIFTINGVPIESTFSTICKVCVSIFLFVSGYGCFKSYSSGKNKINKFGFNLESFKYDFKFIKDRLIKLLFGLWFIYIIFVPLGFLFDRNPIEFYQGNVIFFLLDFTGLSHLFGTPEFNPTWWYFSIAIIFYVIFPVLYRVVDKYPELLLSFGVACLLLPVPNFREIFTYLIVFIFGIYFAKRDIFSYVTKINFNKKVLSFTLFVFIISFAYYRLTVFGTIDSLLSTSIILFSFIFVSKIPLLNRIFEDLGKCSSLIFMFHTFFLIYFEEYVYLLNNSLLIYLCFVLVCYILAKFFIIIQKYIRFNKLVLFFTK